MWRHVMAEHQEHQQKTSFHSNFKEGHYLYWALEMTFLPIGLLFVMLMDRCVESAVCVLQLYLVFSPSVIFTY